MLKIGIDIGNVITMGRAAGVEDTMFTDDFLKTLTMPDVFESIAELQTKAIVHLVSTCGEKTEAKSRAFLHAKGFVTTTGVQESNWHFCKKRSQKAGIARILELDAFIDDKVEILASLPELVRVRLAFRPVETELKKFKTPSLKLHVVQSWRESMRILRPLL